MSWILARSCSFTHHRSWRADGGLFLAGKEGNTLWLERGAEELLIPEVPMDSDELCLLLEEYFKRGKKSAIVVVSEAEHPGVAFLISREVKKKAGFDSKAYILGHIHRGGAPSAH